MGQISAGVDIVKRLTEAEQIIVDLAARSTDPSVIAANERLMIAVRLAHGDELSSGWDDNPLRAAWHEAHALNLRAAHSDNAVVRSAYDRLVEALELAHGEELGEMRRNIAG